MYVRETKVPRKLTCEHVLKHHIQVVELEELEKIRHGSSYIIRNRELQTQVQGMVFKYQTVKGRDKRFPVVALHPAY